ncbi:UDP-glucose 6-dehydrogenase (ugd) [Saccharolobus solfataricus P2]|uniref:UDP-glucose 6-dehydrogenase n=2 Tax=Saccharolobus solfataricus TaxID=2287 RepID=Q7LXG4_SACS2|nr:UDP-glucose/GDP-mannose dehydrogenase family protein [Saccharolobus solfataricus]AAK41109.1 UDP-glucose 6-dehydrogenase (ugd) [Saccharolobus solfataricus P2]CAB57493.1 udp-glucose dehydrogenase [Saccharolobus solfataricus P2]SAI84408.1 UDP-glucose 6-dehydrogenase [Saccharolobus solfataricus]
MRIGVVGLGVVGLVTGAVLADQGHEVVGVDIDQNKVKGLQCNRSPIYEPGLDELLLKNKNRFLFTTDYSALKDVDIVFITVATPTVEGKNYIGYVLDAAKTMKPYLKRDAIVVVKSTVVPGTSRKVKQIVEREVVANPEFLKEGSAVIDTIKPDRIVIGSDSKAAGDVIENLWSFTKTVVLRTSIEEAEMIKYAANSFLATKISFINEIANLCEVIPNCDVNTIAKAIGLDKRIAPYFLNAGLGYGGSCFPKDTLAFASFARELGEELKIVEAAIKVNEERPRRAVKIMEELLGELKGKTICILGIAFKPNTDDTRESVALKIAKLLVDIGANVIAYDPKAKTSLVEMVSSKEECVKRSDGVIIATEWDEFRGIEHMLKDKAVLDGRRVLDPNKMSRSKYRAIGLSKVR